jgi:hypothetical protein
VAHHLTRSPITRQSRLVSPLGWKKSAALLIAVTVNRAGDQSDGVSWDRPALTASAVISLPAGGEVVLTAFDVKRDPADTLTPAHL